MGLRGAAAIVGYTELPSTKRPTGPLESTLEQWTRLAAATLADAGLSAAEVDRDLHRASAGVGDLRPVDNR